MAWAVIIGVGLLASAPVQAQTEEANTEQAQSGQARAGNADAKTVEVTYRVLLSQQSLAEARQQAIRRAQAEAVRQVVGTQVQADETSIRQETETTLVERYDQFIRTGAAGRVTDYTVLEEGVEERGQQTYYRVRVRAAVVPETGQPDPGFSVRLALNDQLFFDRGRPAASDEIIATVEATKDAYLTLFSITADTLQVIWPNAIVEEAVAPANAPVQFPPPDLRAQGLRLRAEVPPERQRATERLLVVATKSMIPFRPTPAFDVTDGALKTVQANVQALNRWLVNIPLGQRAIATVAYEVRRAPQR